MTISLFQRTPIMWAAVRALTYMVVLAMTGSKPVVAMTSSLEVKATTCWKARAVPTHIILNVVMDRTLFLTRKRAFLRRLTSCALAPAFVQKISVFLLLVRLILWWELQERMTRSQSVISLNWRTDQKITALRHLLSPMARSGGSPIYMHALR